MDLQSHTDLVQPRLRRPHDLLDEGHAPCLPSVPLLASDAAALRAAAEAVAMQAVPMTEFAAFWQGLLMRRLNLYDAAVVDRRCYVIAGSDAASGARPGPLSSFETQVLEHVLCGEQQKQVALDRGIACSTTSKWFSQALEKLHLGRRPIPLPIVLVAQATAFGTGALIDARRASFKHRGQEFVLLSVPIATVVRCSLTRAEQQVAGLLVQGLRREQIAIARCTSMQTVACQLRGIVSKFDIKGNVRHELIHHGTELGWFR